MLTSKERAELRAIANPIDTIGQIGKGEIDRDIIKLVDDALTARQLVKFRVLENSQYSAREAAVILAEATESDPVQVIGSRFVLYRPDPKNPLIKGRK
ncbi:MAG: YhbY family RNA-binding protein [Oscillospiraceae bacterium]|jgi:RNA-binding protein|nr:YhbY family RNA-binding protein [Oscillospiraceae bacterium]